MKALATGGPLYRRSAEKSSTFAASAAAVTFAVTLAASNAALADNCKTVSGTVDPLQPVACPGFIGSCFQGTFTGDLQGSVLSALTALLIADRAKGEVVFSAQSALQIQAPNGVVYTRDAGTASGCQFFDNRLVCPSSNEIMTITSGERAYKQVSGQITLSGPYMAGQPGTYQGYICRGNPGP